MKFRSTRDNPNTKTGVTLSEAIELGIAPDGGLFVPERLPLPVFPASNDRETITPARAAEILLAPFFQGDALEKELPAICESTFDFPLPLREKDETTAILELFHGPSAAFKDVGARFLAQCMKRIPTRSARRTILVATSGDTGGAVAAAFHGMPEADVVIVFPKGKISPRQEKQLTSWGGNVRAFSVRGSFDDCQRLVKSAFASETLRSRLDLTSANSINLGRLLPQAAYYAWASLRYSALRGRNPSFIVPSGNLGNVTGALWALAMGLPIDQILLSFNANRVIPDYLSSGRFEPRPSVATLANAMDVGNPSNLERIQDLFPSIDELRKAISAVSVSDEEIRSAIAGGRARWGEIFCPHTATAVHAREAAGNGDWIIVATAHPAKFETIVEPLIGQTLALPESLERLLARPSRSEEIEPDPAAFERAIG